MRNRRILTTLEILVLVSVITFLVAILLPALGKSGSRGGSVCAVNLSGIAKSLNLYSQQFNDHLPVFPTPSNSQWLCDEPLQFSDAILNIAPGTAPPPNALKMFYCPSNPTQDPRKMSNWNDLCVTGYIFLNDRGEAAKNMPHDLAKFSPPPTGPASDRDQPLHYLTQINTPSSAQTVLAADWIVSDSTAASANTGTPKIKRPGPSTLTFNTSHTVNRTTAAGANVLTADSSVHWRNFDEKTATPIKQPGPIHVYFWIPGN